MKLAGVLLVWASTLQNLVAGRAAFAHFMVSNTVGYTVDNWANEIRVARTAHIDAFALNIARGEQTTVDQLGKAFQAANAQGFKLFFSFDYAGNGPWLKSDVISLLTQYAANGAYWRRGTQPLVSTFEGPDNAGDWAEIKTKTGCFFIPDWSSKGAKEALKLGNADGLFNWGAWPEGPNDLYNTIDASYTYYLSLAGLTAYMMPASPWFYTNLPCFDKNWLWRGGSLWYDRWQSIWIEQPDYVQIISWNDFGESHYIGPLPPYESGYEAFERGKAPFNFAKNMPHDGWRAFLPFLIDVYKTGSATITNEGVQAWYRLQPAGACGNGGTTGNTGSQLQIEYNPATLLTDTIYFSALLTSYADVFLSVGGSAIAATWSKTPVNGIGIYHGSADFGSRTGAVVVKITRNSAFIAEMTGAPITTTCQNGLTNWNAWTGSSMSTATTSVSPPQLSSQVCIAGKGVGNLAGLCSYSCARGYCPPTSCTCTQKGMTAIKPTYLVPTVYGCPLPSLDAQYEGLCSFTCGTGYCPPGACFGSATKTTCKVTPAQDPPIPAASPMKPRPTTCPLVIDPKSGVTCNLGTIPAGVDANFMGLCDFSCNHGYCPKPCICLRSGTPVVTAKDTTIGCPAPAYATVLDYYPLCEYTCARGYCPSGACIKSTTACKSLAEPVTEAPRPWNDVKCEAAELKISDNTATDRWKYAKAQDAWTAAQAFFAEKKSSGTTITLTDPSNPLNLPTQAYGSAKGTLVQFSGVIAEYFNADTNKQCQNMNDAACKATTECLNPTTENPLFHSSAGKQIMDSFSNIHTSISDMYAAVHTAQLNTFADAGPAVKLMTNFVDSSKALIVLDSILLVFSLVGAGFWGSNLKTLPSITGSQKDYETLVTGTVTAFVTFGVNTMKNLVKTDSELSTISNFQSLAGGLCRVMGDANAQLLNLLFSGTDDGLTQLRPLIDNGVSSGLIRPNSYNIANSLETAIVAMLLPYLWSANKPSTQFIMTSDVTAGCDPLKPPAMDILTDTERLNGWTCIGPVGYWLLSASPVVCTRTCNTCSSCTGGIAGLKGVENLNGDQKNFGGLTKEALVRSSLNAKAKNGGNNGWKAAVATDTETILAIVKDGVSAAGVFNAPICGRDEALHNVANPKPLAANFPCN